MPNGMYGGVRGRKTKVGRKLLLFSSYSMFAQHERILTGASPQRALTAGSVQPTTRVFIARCNLKEVFGKDLA